MFSKNKNKDKNNPVADASGRSTTPPPRKSDIPSIISTDMHVLGNVVSDGVVDIDGRIEGNVRCQTLTLRRNGHIKGDVVAEAVHVYGHIQGLIKAHNVQFFKGCRVEGVIMHESLTIEDGAFVDGRFKRSERLVLDEAEAPEPQEADEPVSNVPSFGRAATPARDSAPSEKPLKGLKLRDAKDLDNNQDDKDEPQLKVLENLRLISDKN